MKKIFILSALILILTPIMFLPSLALAQEAPSLPNPLQNKDDTKEVNVISILLRVMQIALAVVDIFALFMFILGGFEFLISGGNPTMIKRAKDTLIWATLGILVITLSYTILKFIFEEVSTGF